jgi:hypothetical protein
MDMGIERAAVPLIPTMRAMLGNLMGEGRGRDGRPRTVTGLEGNADADAPSGVELTSDSSESWFSGRVGVELGLSSTVV